MQVDNQCTDLSFAFQVREEHIKYILEDPSDTCLPYTVEGKLQLNFTTTEIEEEALEELTGEIESETSPLEFINDLAEKIVEAEVEEQDRQEEREKRKEKEKPLDNDALVKNLQNQADKLSED